MSGVSRKRREFLKFLGLFSLGFLGAKVTSTIPQTETKLKNFKVVEKRDKLEIYSKKGKKILTVDKEGIVIE